jgi:hypothetical protein
MPLSKYLSPRKVFSTIHYGDRKWKIVHFLIATTEGSQPEKPDRDGANDPGAGVAAGKRSFRTYGGVLPAARQRGFDHYRSHADFTSGAGILLDTRSALR